MHARKRFMQRTGLDYKDFDEMLRRIEFRRCIVLGKSAYGRGTLVGITVRDTPVIAVCSNSLKVVYTVYGANSAPRWTQEYERRLNRTVAMGLRDTHSTGASDAGGCELSDSELLQDEARELILAAENEGAC